MSETFLFVALPYAALLLAFGGGVLRYLTDPFSYSSLSSELLDKRGLFWGSVAWHYGIIPILLAHLFAGLFPRVAAALHASGIATFAVEAAGLALGFMALTGILVLIARRALHPAARAVTSVMDWVLLGALAVQVAAGISVAVLYRWGSVWYLDTASPWFWSLAKLRPDFGTISPLPGLVKLHAVVGFVVIGLVPVTRLVHAVSAPVSYLWRPFQVVRWNRRRRKPQRAS